MSKKRPGMMTCPKCNGTGRIKLEYDDNYIEENSNFAEDGFRDIIVNNVCPKCQGAGEIDWLENVCGKPSFRIPKDGFKVWGQMMKPVYPSTISKDIVSVQPMDAPNTQVYYKDIKKNIGKMKNGG